MRFSNLRKDIKLYVTLLATIYFTSPAWCERWHTFDRFSGLTNEYITDIIETTDGKLWTGTQGGLFSFDGNIWQEVPVDGRIGLSIIALFASTDGALWIEIGTQSRQPTAFHRGAHTLARLHQGNWTWCPSEFEDQTYAIIDIAEASNGDMWITYDLMAAMGIPRAIGGGPQEKSDGRIAVYRNGSLYQIYDKSTPGIKGENFRGIIPKRNGGTWIYAKDFDWPRWPSDRIKRSSNPVDWLLSFDGDSWKNTPLNEILPWSITHIDKNGWGSYAVISGGTEIDDNVFLFESNRTSESINGVFYHDANNNEWSPWLLWAVGQPNGDVHNALDLNNPSINFFDPTAVMTIPRDFAYIGPEEHWFTTNRYAAHVVSGDTTRFSVSSGLAGEICDRVIAAADGSIWISHNEQGVLSRRFRNGIWRTYTGSDGLAGAALTKLYETNDGSLLVGSKKGLMMLVPGLEKIADTTGDLAPWFIGEDEQGYAWSLDDQYVYLHSTNYTSRFSPDEHFDGEQVQKGFVSSQGDLWVANSRYAYRWTSDAWQRYSENEDLDLKNIHFWHESENGDFFIGGRNANQIWTYDPTKDRFKPWQGMPQEIPANSVNSVARGSEGEWYFATRSGLGLYKNGSWTAINTEDGLADNSVNDVLIDYKGNLWCATRLGVSRFDGETWHTFSGDGDLINRNVSRISQSIDGALWFATRRGVSRFIDGIWTSYNRDDGIADRAINDIAIDNNGVAWVATDKGASRFKDDQWTTYTTANGLINDIVRSVAIGKDGSVWFGTSGGLSSLKNGTWSSFTKEDGLVSDRILSLSVDSDDGIWVCTFAGVHHIRQNSIDTVPVGGFEEITASEEECNTPGVAIKSCFDSTISRIYEDSDVGTWFMTSSSGVFLLDPSGTWKHMFQTKTINAFHTDLADRIWIATTLAGIDYVVKIEGDSKTAYTCGVDLGYRRVLDFYLQQSDGSLWTIHDYFASIEGLVNVSTPGRRVSRWYQGNWQVFELQERLPDDWSGQYPDFLDLSTGYEIWDINFRFTEDGKGKLFAFDTQRVHSALVFDGTEWSRLESPLGIEDIDFNLQNSITLTDESTIWFATAAGLHRVSDEGTLQITSDDGMLSGQVHDLLIGPKGRMFISVGTDASQTGAIAIPNAIYRIDLNNPPPTYTLFTDSIDTKIGSNSPSFRVHSREFGNTEVRPFTYALVPAGTEVSPFDWSPLIRDDLIRLSGLENGKWDLHVRATGSFGQFDPTPARARFTVDVTPPTAIINTPSPSDIIGNQIAVLGSAFDQSPLEDFTQYTLEYTEGKIATVEENSDWIPIAPLVTDEVVSDTLGVWDVSALSGNYLLRVRASDDLEHHSEYIVPIVVDNTPPLVELDPIDADSTYSGTIAIRGTISDAHPAEYQVGYRRLSGEDDAVHPIYTGPIENISDNQLVIWDSSDETGAIQVVVTAFDQAGNSSDPAEIAIRLDNSSALPHAEITFPQPEAVLSGVIEVSGRLADSRFSHYRLEILDPQLVTDEVEGLNPVQSGEFVLVNFDTRDLANGKYVFGLQAYNKEGYDSYSSVPFTIDNTPPLTRLAYPTDADTLRGWIEIEGKISDKHLSSYQLSYGPGLNPPESEMTILDSGSESTVEHSVAWNTLALHGQYTLVLAGVDAAGLSSTQRRSVWIENPPISASEGGSREFDAIQIFVPPGSPSEDIALGVRTYDADPTLDPGSEDLRIAGRPFEIISAPSAINLQRPATLRVPYEHTAAAEKLALFRLGSDQAWQRIGGTLNQSENTISTAIDSFGTFVLLEDYREYGSSTGALSNLQCQPRMVSPRGGWTEQTQISFRLADRAPVSVMVYNMAGQRKKTLLEATLNTGVHSVGWSGHDNNGDMVEDGMYIVVTRTTDNVLKQVIGVINGGQ